MLKLFFKKNSNIEELLFEYLSALQASQEGFRAGMKVWTSPGYRLEDLEYHAKQTHKHESKADDTRDTINDLMYGKVLIPESRGDIMTLVGRMDKILNCFERVLTGIQIQRLEVPIVLRSHFDEIIEVSLQSCDALWSQFEKFLRGEMGIREKLHEVDELESRCDLLERRILSKIFAPESDMDPFLKLQFKELIGAIGDISDAAELVARRINILSLKRRV